MSGRVGLGLNGTPLAPSSVEGCLHSADLRPRAGWRPSWGPFAALLSVLLGSCGFGRTVAFWTADLDGGVDAGPGPQRSWGEYSAGLGLPDCPPAPELMVNTTADELNGGTGPTLSLADALWIAANSPGPEKILFDAEVFPAEAPATILLSGTHELPVDPSPVCIDGRGRGVIVEWTPEAPQTTGFIGVGAGSRVQGLTLIRMPLPLLVRRGGVVAGCRLGTDGFSAVLSASAGETTHVSGTLGPANAIAGSSYGAVLFGDDAHVVGNTFGWDPVTRKSVPLTSAIKSEFDGAHTVEGNVLSGSIGGTAIAVWGSSGSPGMSIVARNSFGVDGTGGPLPAPLVALHVSGRRRVLVESNIIRFEAKGIQIIPTWGAIASISRNSFWAGTAAVVSYGAIVFQSEPPTTPAPVVLTATSTEASGSCAALGTVEVYQTMDGGLTFLTDATCHNNQKWQAPVQVASGARLLATLTPTDGGTSPFSAPVEVR